MGAIDLGHLGELDIQKMSLHTAGDPHSGSDVNYGALISGRTGRTRNTNGPIA